MKTHVEFKKTLLNDPAVRAEYDALKGEFELCAQLIKTHARAGLPQAAEARPVVRLELKRSR